MQINSNWHCEKKKPKNGMTKKTPMENYEEKKIKFISFAQWCQSLDKKRILGNYMEPETAS